MSWKEKQLITILSAILGILCIAVLIVLSIRYRETQTAQGDDVAAAAELAKTAQSNYVALSYQNGNAYLRFALNEDGVWCWESEPGFPLDDSTVRSILALLDGLTPQQTLDAPEDLSEYGLSTPQASLLATTPSGAEVSIAFGNTTTDGDSYYVSINNDADHLYIISDALYLAMQTPIYEMCRLPELPALTGEVMSSISIQGPETAQSGDSGETEPTQNTTTLTAVHMETETRWRCNGVDVTDWVEVRALMEDLAALQAAACVDYRPSDAAVSFCGFDAPATLAISYTASGLEETFSMRIGAQNPEETGRYVQFGDEDAIYLVELSLLDPMMRIAAQGLDAPDAN